MTLFAHAVTATLSLMVLLITEIDERVQAINRFDVDMAATATIAAIWPTKFNIGFAPECSASVPTMASLDIDFGFIEKFHKLSFR
jgi:hypothetical protein